MDSSFSLCFCMDRTAGPVSLHPGGSRLRKRGPALPVPEEHGRGLDDLPAEHGCRSSLATPTVQAETRATRKVTSSSSLDRSCRLAICR